jgi:hypothetical protein
LNDHQTQLALLKHCVIPLIQHLLATHVYHTYTVFFLPGPPSVAYRSNDTPSYDDPSCFCSNYPTANLTIPRTTFYPLTSNSWRYWNPRSSRNSSSIRHNNFYPIPSLRSIWNLQRIDYSSNHTDSPI